MKSFKFLFTLICAIALWGCTSDEPITPEVTIPGLTDQSCLPDVVSDMGGEVSVNFTTNTDWYIYSENGAEVIPSEGQKGNNTVRVIIPQNTDTQWNRGFTCSIYSRNNEYLSEFTIIQDKAPLLECPSVIEIEQKQTTYSFSIKSNGQFEIIVPADAQEWLSASAQIDASKPTQYDVELKTSENSNIEDRKAEISVVLGSATKNIEVTQKGGVIVYSTFTNMSTSERLENKGGYTLSPSGGKYSLSISSNCSFTYEVESTQDNYVTVTETSHENDCVNFDINALELPKSESSCWVDIKLSFANEETETIRLTQNDWSLSVYVRNGEKLSTKINELSELRSQGYYIDYININGGIIDIGAPSTVTSVSVSNVDNIMEGFCQSCTNLKSISLSNVKQIGARAFLEHKCSSISIPSTVTYIGDRAFLRYGTAAWYPYVTCHNPNPPTLGSWVFHDGTGSGVLRVPMGSKPKYKANSSWSKQFDIFEEF